MDIVPTNGELIIEAKIGVDDIDEVHPGTASDIRFSAYKQRSTPLVMGRVIYVAADRTADEQTGVPYYVIQVKADESSLQQAKDVKLYPGMPAEVFIRTRQRTALQYLIEPVTNTLRRSLRES